MLIKVLVGVCCHGINTVDANVSIVAQTIIRQKKHSLGSEPLLTVSHFSEKVSLGPGLYFEDWTPFVLGSLLYTRIHKGL